MSAELLERVRHDAGLTQEELAMRAGTSRTTLSAYEHGRKSPTMATVERLFGSAGFELSANPLVNFAKHMTRHGRPFFVPDQLWRLHLGAAFAKVSLPLSLNWSRPGSVYSLRNSRQRSCCYEIVIREGRPKDMLRLVDGALLIDLWADLVLPREMRSAWQPVIERALA